MLCSKSVIFGIKSSKLKSDSKWSSTDTCLSVTITSYLAILIVIEFRHGRDNMYKFKRAYGDGL